MNRSNWENRILRLTVEDDLILQRGEAFSDRILVKGGNKHMNTIDEQTLKPMKVAELRSLAQDLGIPEVEDIGKVELRRLILEFSGKDINEISVHNNDESRNYDSELKNSDGVDFEAAECEAEVTEHKYASEA